MKIRGFTPNNKLCNCFALFLALPNERQFSEGAEAFHQLVRNATMPETPSLGS